MVAISLSLMATLNARLNGQNWSRFRGPNGQGVISSPANPTSYIDLPIEWRTELPGKAHSSPVVWGNRVFVTSADQESGLRYALCLDSADGNELWRKEFSGEVFEQHEFNSFASSTPAVDERCLYIAWAAPHELFLVALNHQGEEAWRTGLGEFKSRHGHGVSPIVCEDLVVLPCDQDFAPSFVVGVDRAKGDVRWRIARQFAKEEQDAAYATPCIYQPSQGGAQLITLSRPDGICALEPSTGKTVWQYPAFPYRPVGSAVITKDGLIVAGNPTTIAVRPPNAEQESPEEVYRIANSVSPYIPTPICVDDLVFLWADTGIVQCIDGASGKRHWKKRIGGEFHSSPIAVGKTVYCISTEGELVALAASAEFQELGRRQFDEKCSATPAILDSAMLVRTANSLICIGDNTRNRLAQ